MISEIFVEGQRLDITADISSLLTFAIDDIKDFSSRQTTFSKTVVIPGTFRNKVLFGNIFETGIANDYDPSLSNSGINFNPSISARCLIFQDNLQTFKGTARVLEVINDRGNIEFEIALNGELTGLNVALSSGFLTDLDFSIYNVLYTAANIAASWDNTPGSGVYFPLIDYGAYSTNKHDWDLKTFRPALYAKEYIDKMFAEAGYSYTCDLFNTDRFKKLIVPHNTKTLMSKVSNILAATTTIDRIIIDTTHGITSNKVLWDSTIAGGFSYSLGTFTYTQPDPITAVIQWNLGGDRFSATNGNFIISIRKNGVAIATTTIPTFAFHVGYTYSDSTNITLATGDTVDVFYQYGGTGTAQEVHVDGLLNITSTIPTLLPVDYNQLITINDAIPQNIRQVDFLLSIVKLFNIYVYESQFDEKLILMTPFVDFYSSSTTNAVDWTYKLNRRQPISIKPMSELNSKIYNFNYRDDNDYYNELYSKRYNQGYGSRIFDSQFEFASQENTLELIFAPTPLVGYVGEDKVYSTIYKKNNNIEEQVDSVIRILQSRKITSVASWQIVNGTLSTTLGTFANYGYAGHLDDPDNPSNDLNFGALKELFFILVTGDLSKTQFNLYWSSYMAEITDKDSKLLTAKFYLTPNDIFNLSFAKYVVVDGVLFRLNKITDYNVSIPSDCEVELLKVINTSYTFVPAPFPDDEDHFLLWDDTEFLIDSDNGKIEYI
jgi:hypothetical protein